MTEAEQRLDSILWRRLATDRAYKHAEDADAQASREAQIVAEIEADYPELAAA